MKNVCKGICINYKSLKTYVEGAVRCRSCYEFLDWDGNWCPCCKCRVSRRARGRASKSLGDKLNQVVRI
jgi:hypothetical protein